MLAGISLLMTMVHTSKKSSSMPSSAIVDSSDSEALDATTPLLGRSNDPELQPVRSGRTPLPMVQLAAVCLARLSDPVAFSQIFPYVNEAIVSTNSPSRHRLSRVEPTFLVTIESH
jgi:hypothetical protein